MVVLGFAYYWSNQPNTTVSGRRLLRPGRGFNQPSWATSDRPLRVPLRPLKASCVTNKNPGPKPSAP